MEDIRKNDLAYQKEQNRILSTQNNKIEINNRIKNETDIFLPENKLKIKDINLGSIN